MDAYLAKPVTIARLSAVLQRWMALAPPMRPPMRRWTAAMLRIWLGDDEPPTAVAAGGTLPTAPRDRTQREIEAALAGADMRRVLSLRRISCGVARSIWAPMHWRMSPARLEALPRTGRRRPASDANLGRLARRYGAWRRI